MRILITKTQEYLDDTVAGIDEMLDLVEAGNAVEVEDDDEQRGAVGARDDGEVTANG